MCVDSSLSKHITYPGIASTLIKRRFLIEPDIADLLLLTKFSQKIRDIIEQMGFQ